MKVLQRLFACVGLAALLISLAPQSASAANCNFSRPEKILMVTWVVPIAGAVLTPLACKRTLFKDKKQSAALELKLNAFRSDKETPKLKF